MTQRLNCFSHAETTLKLSSSVLYGHVVIENKIYVWSSVLGNKVIGFVEEHADLQDGS